MRTYTISVRHNSLFRNEYDFNANDNTFDMCLNKARSLKSEVESYDADAYIEIFTFVNGKNIDCHIEK